MFSLIPVPNVLRERTPVYQFELCLRLREGSSLTIDAHNAG
jgi:hypothetical protein